jgi:hypothetical protein
MFGKISCKEMQHNDGIDICYDIKIPVDSCSENGGPEYWPTAEEFVFPQDAFKCVEMAMWTANKVASDYCLQLNSGPQETLLVRDIQLLTNIRSNPLC